METLSAILVLAALQLNLMKVQVANASIEPPRSLTASTTEELVRDYFKDIPIMAEIARCESTFRQFDENGEVLKGDRDKNDTGVFQISKRWHPQAVGIETLEGNMRFARRLYELRGTKDWKASASCWDREL